MGASIFHPSSSLFDMYNSLIRALSSVTSLLHFRNYADMGATSILRIAQARNTVGLVVDTLIYFLYRSHCKDSEPDCAVKLLPLHVHSGNFIARQRIPLYVLLQHIHSLSLLWMSFVIQVAVPSVYFSRLVFAALFSPSSLGRFSHGFGKSTIPLDLFEVKVRTKLISCAV